MLYIIQEELRLICAAQKILHYTFRLDDHYTGCVCFAACEGFHPIIYCGRRARGATEFVIDGNRFRCIDRRLLRALFVRVIHAAIDGQLTVQYMRGVNIDEYEFIYDGRYDCYEFVRLQDCRFKVYYIHMKN